MSLGGIGKKKNPNNWFDLVETIIIGMAFFVFGIWAIIDRFLFNPMGHLIDLGKYHRIIGAASIACGFVYLFLIIENYSKET